MRFQPHLNFLTSTSSPQLLLNRLWMKEGSLNNVVDAFWLFDPQDLGKRARRPSKTFTQAES